VDVRVVESDAKVILVVKDYGMGVPREILDRFWKTGNTGVGLAGIRERLKELGGFLEIESNLDGTLLRATIPFPSSQTKERDATEPVFVQEDAPHALPLD
jgi:signal transduction histidine kinase